ncbi:MAG: Fibronectin type domain protein [Cytophagaceae bacterium]|nr:Fibronectin type domain protein [Cytophagaceae bacterium]
MDRRIACFILVLWNCLAYCTFAQSNQVMIIASAGPSNSTLLSDYYNGKQTGLSLLLRNDSRQPLVQGYLRINIEGQGVKLQTGSYAIFPSIDIMEGSTVNLGPQELAVYFKPQYLQGSIGFGVNQPNVFPEGFYQFCFEFLEKNTNRVIGSLECVQANLAYSEPVDLILPEQGKTIAFSSAQSLTFQWNPRHVNIENSEYIVTLVELNTSDKVTESAFAKAKQVYIAKMNEVKFVYNRDKPALLKGKKYAWRVQASAATSNAEKEPMNHEGYSEIHWFLLD